MKVNKITFAFACFLCMIFLLFAGCAGSQGGEDASGDASMKDAPCQECGTRGDIELKISNEKTYR